MNKKAIFLLFGIFLLGYFLRVMFLPQLGLTFGYDQARDAYISQQILSGDIKILGPPASTPGLFHGVLYYYALAPGYLFSQSPIAAAYWMAFINALTVFVAAGLAYMMTKKTGAAVMAALFFAISFEATQYATWLSNPTLGVLTVPLMYLGLWAWTMEKKKWGPVVAGIGLGFSIQAEVFLLYHAVPLLVWLWASKNDIKLSQFFLLAMSGFLAVSTMIIAEIKFGFKGIGGALSLLSTGEPIRHAESLGDILTLYLNQLGKVFAFSTYPGNIGYGGAFVLALIIISLIMWKKWTRSWEPFMALWLFSHATVVSVGGDSTPFLLVGIGSGVSILLGIFIAKWWREGLKPLAIIATIVIIYGNISTISQENPQGSTIFSIQKDMLLSKQLPAIDYTYFKASGEPFSTNSITSPFWINIVWTYLYNWHGQEGYGYVPKWHGKDQIGQLDSLEQVDNPLSTSFLIIEPPAGIPKRLIDETLAEESYNTELVDEFILGELTVQERRSNSNE